MKNACQVLSVIHELICNFTANEIDLTLLQLHSDKYDNFRRSATVAEK